MPPLSDDDMPQVETHLKSKRKQKQITRRILLVVWLLLFVFVAYFAIQVVVVLTPNLRTETALLETMTDSITVQGLVALESQAVTGSGGVLYYTVPSGERVTGGTQVAEVYAGEAGAEARAKQDELDEEIEQVEAAMKTVTYSGDTGGYTNNVNSSMAALLDVIDTGDYTELHPAENAVALAYNKLLMATGESVGLEGLLSSLQNQRAGYEAAAIPLSSIAAPESGYFVAASGNDRVPLGYDTLQAFTPQQLSNQLSMPADYYGSDVIGYIISDYKWHFFALVPPESADRFVEGDNKLHITFSETGSTELPVTVVAAETDDATGWAKVELYCEYMSPQILQMQNQTVDIVFGTYKGLRVSKDALRFEEVADEEGTVSTYRGVYTEFGGVVTFKKISILLEDEYYMLVSIADSSLEMYDEVIIDSGGVALSDGTIL